MKFFFVLVCLFAFQFSNAQTSFTESNGVFILNPNQKSDEGKSFKRGSYTDLHYFGEDISAKLNLFERNYVYFIPGSGAYSVEETKILKPQIYKKVKFIEKSLVKAVKSKKMQLAEAESKLSDMLSLSIQLLNYDTSKVEIDLKELKTMEEIIDYLSKIKFYDSKL